MIVPSAPGWFVEEMTEILIQSVPSTGNDVEILGAYPDITEYHREHLNDHHGKRYTPEFNEYSIVYSPVRLSTGTDRLRRRLVSSEPGSRMVGRAVATRTTLPIVNQMNRRVSKLRGCFN